MTKRPRAPSTQLSDEDGDAATPARKRLAHARHFYKCLKCRKDHKPCRFGGRALMSQPDGLDCDRCQHSKHPENEHPCRPTYHKPQGKEQYPQSTADPVTNEAGPSQAAQEMQHTEELSGASANAPKGISSTVDAAQTIPEGNFQLDTTGLGDVQQCTTITGSNEPTGISQVEWGNVYHGSGNTIPLGLTELPQREVIPDPKFHAESVLPSAVKELETSAAREERTHQFKRIYKEIHNQLLIRSDCLFVANKCADKGTTAGGTSPDSGVYKTVKECADTNLLDLITELRDLGLQAKILGDFLDAKTFFEAAKGYLSGIDSANFRKLKISILEHLWEIEEHFGISTRAAEHKAELCSLQISELGQKEKGSESQIILSNFLGSTSRLCASASNIWTAIPVTMDPSKFGFTFNPVPNPVPPLYRVLQGGLLRRFNLDYSILDQDSEIFNPGELIPWNNESLLHWAARNNDFYACDYGLERSVPVDGLNSNGETPLLIAASANHIDIAERLLRAGANVNGPIRGFPSPLHLSVEKEHIGMVGLLLANRADINLPRFKDDKTPDRLAVETGNQALNTLFLTYAAPQPFNPEQTPLSSEIMSSRTLDLPHQIG